MIHLPQLTQISTTSEYIEVWGGYDHNSRAQGNTFYEMQNMGCEDYPLLGTRKNRATVRTLTKGNGLFAHNALGWADGTELWYNGSLVEGLELEDSPKRFVNMGAFVCIFPDKKWYNTYTGEYGSMERVNTTTGTVTCSMCKLDGDQLIYTASDTAPEDPENGQTWLDTSTVPNVLKYYSSATEAWSSAAVCYVKIYSEGIGIGISTDDAVDISGLATPDLNGSFVVYGRTDDYIIITGLIAEQKIQSEPVTVSRTVPEMDFVCELDNRLWGCSSENHEIYSCVLGDFKNWRKYNGVSTDAYAMTVGSQGDFTGCCSYGGNVIFFKENLMHRISGSRPANYAMTTTNSRGVQKGSHKSLCAIDEQLYYKAPLEVCCYTLSLPTGISDNFGAERYTDAVCGAVENRLYMCCKDKDGHGVMFCFDTKQGIWYKEDDTYAEYFAPLKGELYYLEGNVIKSVLGTIPEEYKDDTAEEEGTFDSVAQLADIGLSSAANKYISSIRIRIVVDDGAHVDVWTQYDQQKTWAQAAHIPAAKRRSLNVPIIPKRCDTMRIKLTGNGSWRIYSLSKATEAGSEV